MAPSARQLVRNAVGLAAVAPGIALIVLAVVLVADGGFSGFLAGGFVALLGVGLMVVALMATHAPVSIRKLLDKDEDSEDSNPPGPNGQRSELDDASSGR